MQDKRGLRNIVSFVCLVGSLSANMATSHVEAADPVAQDVINAWRARADRIKSFRCQWHVTRTIAKGAYSGHTDLLKKGGASGGQSRVPPETTSYELPFRLLGAGERLKAELSELYVNESSQLATQKWMWTFDGNERRGLSQPDVDSFPQGSRAKALSDRDANSIDLMPLVALVRPFSPVADPIRELISNMTLVPGTASVSGRPCCLLKQETTSDLSGQLWVDIEHDYVPMRYIQTVKGKTSSQIDFLEYKQTDVGWIPRTWKTIVLGRDGKIRKSSEATVQVLELNGAIPESEFEIKFPVGTLVRDQFEGRDYLVLEGGAKRVLALGDLVNRSYDSLMSEARWSWRLPVKIVVGVLCLLGGIYLWRRTKPRPVS